MAKAESKFEATILLELTPREASFIKGMMQNFIGENPEDEDQVEKDMRKSIFETLKEANVY